MLKPGYVQKFDEYRAAAAALVARMTLEEAVSQLRYDAPPIGSLGVPAYNWWSEGLHGLARAGTATVFPQAIAMAAAFDTEGVAAMGRITATEARAKYNALSAMDDRDIYKGLTIFSPNINIFRDPRWGRGQETYGEDPYLTSQMGLAYIGGLQGDGEYLLCAACAKHFAVHSGPEALRHEFNAEASLYDMEDTYLPAFEAAVREAHVALVMGAYNRTNGEPCCASPFLMKTLLRERWGFDGCFVSDFMAIRDFHEGHNVTADAPESAALALGNTCDLNLGNTYLHLMAAWEAGLVTEDAIRTAAVRVMAVRFALGLFDKDCALNAIPFDVIDCEEHNRCALESSRRSKVLLKNNGILPLDTKRFRRIAVIGPTADSRAALHGNYFGTSSHWVTILDGLRAALPQDVRLSYAEGSHLFLDRTEPLALPDDRLTEAAATAAAADVVILCLGLDATIEGEQGDTGNSEAAGDKPDLLLPAPQRRLLDTALGAGKPVVLVLSAGSPLDISDAHERCDAIVMDWYGGAQGGRATAELLLGRYSPSGRLPITFPRDAGLPAFEDYSMAGRTYRYAENEPLYPFGYGLSYTEFVYRAMTLSEDRVRIGSALSVDVIVENMGRMDAEEVVQLYLRREESPRRAPRWALCGFQRVAISAGQSCRVTLPVHMQSLTAVQDDGVRIAEPGRFTLFAGGRQPDSRSEALSGSACLLAVFEVTR